MSYGNPTRGSRSGGKGASPKKTNRKKKQTYHKRKQQTTEQGPPDAEQLKARVVASLDKLGHQRLSTEPGGYDLQSWTRSLDALLDDYESKLGSSHFPEAYRQLRHQMAQELQSASDVSAVDGKIAGLRAKRSEISKNLDEEKRSVSAKLAQVSSEIDRLSAAEASGESHTTEAPKEKPSIFRRLFGGGRSTPADVGRKEETANQLVRLRTESAELTTKLEQLDSTSRDGPALDLSHIDAELSAAEAERERLLQVEETRGRLADEFAKIISQLPASGTEKNPAES